LGGCTSIALRVAETCSPNNIKVERKDGERERISTREDKI
jgi:hypothetical protein